jgi:hypothetical protein
VTTLLHAKRAIEARLGCPVHFERGPFSCHDRGERPTHDVLVVAEDRTFRDLSTGEDHVHAIERSQELLDAWDKADAEECRGDALYDAQKDARCGG